MTAATLRRTWKNEYFKTAITVILIITIVFGFWFGLRWVLNTPYPALAVASGSMCMVQHMYCDGWSHPFSHTLHVGDLIIVQGTDPKEIKVAPYPNGDIIVFHRGSELIVHRAIAKEKRGDKWYFQTKGDGNNGPDSSIPNIPEDQVVGKVVLRIPWIGHVALFMRESYGIYAIIVLVAILVIVEFVFPAFSSEESGKTKRKEDVKKLWEPRLYKEYLNIDKK